MYWNSVSMKKWRSSANLRPKVAVQGAILHRFGDVLLGDLLSPSQIRDRLADLENSVISPRRQAPLCDCPFEQCLGPRAELAMLPNKSRRHLSVAINGFASEAFLLNPAGAVDPRADFGGPFG